MKNLTFRTKLIILLLIPLVAIFYFLAREVVTKVSIIRDAATIETLTQLSVKTSALIHEVQKERGLSNGYIGSGGTKFKEDLLTQRQLTDQKKQELAAFSQQFSSAAFGPEFTNYYQNMFLELEQLERHRTGVTNLSVTSKENFTFYTDLNTLMLQMITQISDRNFDRKVAPIITSYENIVKGKEAVGKERALGVNALAQNKFEQDSYEEFLLTIAEQKIYFTSFKELAPEDEEEFFIQETSDPVFFQTAQLEETLIQKAMSGNFGIDPQLWFDLITQKINILKIVEDKVSSDLIIASAQVKKQAEQDLLFFIPLATIVFLGFLSTILYVLSSMTRSLGRILEGTKIVTSGDLNFRIGMQGYDEMSKLATSFDQMTSQLQLSYRGLEEKIEQQTGELSVKVNDLEATKKAMLNVMEDMQHNEAKINEQKKILDTVVHNTPIGISLNEPSGKSILVNEAGIALVGRGIDPNARNEDIGKFYQIFKPDGGPYPMEELVNVIALRTGNPATKDDVVVHRPDGKQIAMRATSVPIKNSQGQIVSVLSVFEDVTKEREVDRMKTEFISLASHQLRTPLSAIKWFSEMLVNGDAGELTKEQKEFSQNISASAERMIELVNSLLNISRIESGRIVVDPRPTDLKELVQGVVTDLEAKIKEREQNLIISVREDLPKINLDPHLIRQVYMNLLTNAIKYTPKGGEITVFVSRKGDEVISQVTDNGYGIPKAQQGKMFQKFFRAENIVKVETDGTGLGLYLIKAIIESSKGRIWFESEEGKGTTFWFSIPMSGMEAKKGEVTLDAR